MIYKLLLLISAGLTALQIAIPESSYILIPLLLVLILIRNPKSLWPYLKFLLPPLAFMVLLYLVLGEFAAGLKSILLLCGASLSLQLYFNFFPKRSLYELLIRSGIPKKAAFVVYGAVNYTLLIKPLIREIQDAQRLRGFEIPKGPASLFHLHRLLIPLMVKLLQGAEHLAESLYLRSAGDDPAQSG